MFCSSLEVTGSVVTAAGSVVVTAVSVTATLVVTSTVLTVVVGSVVLSVTAAVAGLVVASTISSEVCTGDLDLWPLSRYAPPPTAPATMINAAAAEIILVMFLRRYVSTPLTSSPTAVFSASLLQSSVSHDPSEIVLIG